MRKRTAYILGSKDAQHMFSTHLYVKSSTGTINHDKVFLYYLKGVAQNLQLTKMVVLPPFLANSAPSTLNLGSDGYLEVLNRSWLHRYDTIEKMHKNTKITKKKPGTRSICVLCHNSRTN